MKAVNALTRDGVFSVMQTMGKSLSFKFTIVIALMSLTIGFLIIFFGYQIYERQNIEEYSKRGEAMTAAAAEVVDWDRISYYAESLEEDEEYEETLAYMRTIARSADVEYLYVLYPYDENGAIFIYDTDESEDRCELGYYTDWESEFEDNTDALLRGERIEPFISDTEWGWILSIYEPFYDSNNNFVGYLGVDYTADKIMASQNRYIASLTGIAVVVTVVVTLIFLFILRRIVIKPMDKIVNAASSYTIQESKGKTVTSDSIAKLEIKSKDEFKTLDTSLKYMDATIEEYIDSLEHANHRAETDSMTGLLNRESFKDYVSLILQQEQDTTNAFMMLDLDKFKNINDTYGHLVGDEVIESCVHQIRKMFRSTDLVARMGGDEFAVFCRGPISRENVEKRAQQLCEYIRRTLVNGEISFTISIGVVYFNASDVPTYQSLYLQADVALYETKEHGRDGYTIRDFDPGLMEHAEE